MTNKKWITSSFTFLVSMLLISACNNTSVDNSISIDNSTSTELNDSPSSVTNLSTRENKMNFDTTDDLVQLNGLSVKINSSINSDSRSENENENSSQEAKERSLIPLSEEDTASLLSALPKQVQQPPQPSFAWRSGSKPPLGSEFKKIENWQPGKAPDAPEELEPLKIISATPTGKVSEVNRIQIRFSQDMYALGQQAGESGEKYVSIEPKVEGHFTWLDTRTLRFEAQPGFALASRYTVEISTSMRTHSGNQLKTPYKFSFKTPAPKLNYHFPDNQTSVSQTPVIVLNFSTPVNSASLLEKVYLKLKSKDKSGSKEQENIKFRLATEEDFAADPLLERSQPDTSNAHSISIVPLQVLQKGVSYTMHVPAKIKPEEGDIVSEKTTRFSITVEKDLTFVKISCGYHDDVCRPQDVIIVEFNNVLESDSDRNTRGLLSPRNPFSDFNSPDDDTDNDTDEQDHRIKTSPHIEGLRVDVVDNKIYIYGKKKPHTRYTISMLESLSDIFGNQLTKTISKTITTSVDDYWGESIIAESFVVIPGYSQSLYSFFTNRVENVSIQIYKVKPQDFNQYFRFADAFYDKYEGYMQTHASVNYSKNDKQPPGELVYESQLAIKNPLGFSAHVLKLDKAFENDSFNNSTGHAMVVLRADKARKNYDDPDGKIIWIQKTNIGLSIINDASQGLVLASDLATGKPLNNVNVQVYGQELHASTEKNGVAKLSRNKYRDSLAIIASKGADSALLPWDGSRLWVDQQGNSLLWYVADDRKLYRPGEKIVVKGWLRNYTRKNNGQLSLLKGQNSKNRNSKDKKQTIEYIFSDAQNQEIGKGKINVTGIDGFDIEFTLPQEMNLGQCVLKLKLFGTQGHHYHYFRVEEFRRPEFEVLMNAKSDSGSASQNVLYAGSHIVGQTVNFNLAAKYFAGGSLANASVEWNAWSKQGYFTPPNQQDYYFGQQRSWWKFGRRHYQRDIFPSGHTVQDQTDSRGEAHLSFELSSIHSNSPMLLDVQASVSDVNRQTFTGSSSALIHPSSNYVGIKTKSQFYNLGELLKIESIVADLDGELVSDRPVQIRVSSYNSQSGSQKPVVCKLVSSQQPQFCDITLDTSGIYSIEATTQDDKGRTHQARQYIWVAGVDLPGDSVENQSIKLIGKTEDLHEDDELRVMLQAPFAPAQIMLSILREGFIENRIFSMKTTSELISINLDQRHSPGFELRVHAVGGGDKPNSAPQYAMGSQIYNVRPDSEIFSIEVSTANKIVSPGSEIELSIKANDLQGAVANAEVAIFVVDEAVLATADYRLPDPLEVFHQFRSAGISVDELRAHIKIPPTPEELENLGIQIQESMMMERGRMKSKRAFAPSVAATNGEVSVRKNFSALALFSPTTQTDENGEAKIKFTLPDSLTRYRITVIAAKDANRFAYGENNITAQLSLMVRPMPPRFSNVGDRFELPVVIQNISDHTIETDIVLRAQNLHLEKNSGWRINVPANDRVEVRFPVKPESPGIAEGDVVIHGDDHFDAAHFSLPIWTPLAQESEAIYGEIDQGVHSYPINFPKNVVSNFGGISIQTSATALNNLGDAYVYLRDYPYSCTEQIASRVLSVAALGNLLDNLDAAKNESKQQRFSRLKQDVKMLLSRQKHNGAFGLWSQQSAEHSYASIHVIHALFYAKQQNIEVDQNQLQQGLNYLRNIEENISEHYSVQAKRVLRAYAVYVLSLYGDSQFASMAKILFAEMKPKLETQSLSAIAWLLSALPENEDFDSMRNSLIKHIANHTDQTTSSAHVGSVYTRDGYTHMASTRKNDALVLGALIAQDQDSVFISKFMRGLMDKRIKGRWNNTQENVFVLLAALKYFNQFEKTSPNFVVSTWLGQNFAGSSSFKERMTVTKELMIPESLVGSGNQPLTISKEGDGRLYYRIGIDYALDKEQIDARSQGFSVERHFESAEDDPDAVKKSAGIWHIKAGALVRVTLTMKVPGQRYYVALVDPLAAGLEALNPSLANTATRPHANSASGDELQDYWSRNWFSHQNLHDERAEVFADQLWGGEFKYSYLTRATTLGRFIVAPARAEEMYHPETFGHSASDIVVVE